MCDVCDWMQSVNRAMQKDKDELTIGVLDIYGFEIFMVHVKTYSKNILLRVVATLALLTTAT